MKVFIHFYVILFIGIMLIANISKAQDPWYFERTGTNFENNCYSGAPYFTSCDNPFVVDTTLPNNIWQFGRPNKSPQFDSAYSPPNALVTDTLNMYPPNNYSIVQYKYLPLYIPGIEITDVNIDFVFTHKFNTDKGKDGMYIEFFAQNKNWVNILNFPSNSTNNLHWEGHEFHLTTEGPGPCVYTIAQFVNYYDILDTLSNGEIGFSGNSNGWIISWLNISTSLFCDNINGIRDDTIALRFVFVSDSIDTQKEGWIIDDLDMTIQANYIIGIDENEIVNKENISIYPNPAKEELNLKFKKEDKYTAQILNIQGKMLQQIIFNGSQIKMNISTLKAGIYILKISTYNNTYIRKLSLY